LEVLKEREELKRQQEGAGGLLCFFLKQRGLVWEEGHNINIFNISIIGFINQMLTIKDY
jgi:hypothetical protein